MNKYKYFKQEEFACKDGCGKQEMSHLLVTMLDQAREISKVPFKINSGRRCETHNAKVGGSPTSSHMKGLAVDIRANNSVTRNKILKGLIKAGFNRIGIYKTFIHVDIDTTKPDNVTWLG